MPTIAITKGPINAPLPASSPPQIKIKNTQINKTFKSFNYLNLNLQK